MPTENQITRGIDNVVYPVDEKYLQAFIDDVVYRAHKFVR